MNSSTLQPPALELVADKQARVRQNIGEENHADGTRRTPRRIAQQRSAVDRHEVEANSGGVTWLTMLRLNVADIACQENEQDLIDLLTDAGVNIVNWIDCIHRRQAARRTSVEGRTTS